MLHIFIFTFILCLYYKFTTERENNNEICHTLCVGLLYNIDTKFKMKIKPKNKHANNMNSKSIYCYNEELKLDKIT